MATRVATLGAITFVLGLAFVQFSSSTAQLVAPKTYNNFRFLPLAFDNQSSHVYFSASDGVVLLQNCLDKRDYQSCVIKAQFQDVSTETLECWIDSYPNYTAAGKPLFIGNSKVLLTWKNSEAEDLVQVVDLPSCANISQTFFSPGSSLSVNEMEPLIFPWRKSFDYLYKNDSKIIRLEIEYSSRPILESGMQFLLDNDEGRQLLYVMQAPDETSGEGYYIFFAAYARNSSRTFLGYEFVHISNTGEVYFVVPLPDPSTIKFSRAQHIFLSNAHNVFTACYPYDLLAVEPQWTCFHYERYKHGYKLDGKVNYGNKFTNNLEIQLLEPDSDMVGVFNLEEEKQILFVTAKCQYGRPLMTLKRFNLVDGKVMATDSIYLSDSGHCVNGEKFKHHEEYRINVVERHRGLAEVYVTYEGHFTKGDTILNGVLSEKFVINLSDSSFNN